MIRHEGRTSSIIVIGNEILSGKVADKNSFYLLRELRALGVDVQRIAVIPDRIDAIAEEIALCWRRFDLVFTSGGIGPTHDDVTMEGIAAGVRRPLAHHPVLDQLLKNIYAGALNAAQMKLADVPEGTGLISSGGIRIPVLHFENIYIFPGIPDLLIRKFEAIKERFREPPFHLIKVFISKEEHVIAEVLNEIVRKFPCVLLGSYPALNRSDYKVILTLESKNLAWMEDALQTLLLRLSEDAIFKIEENGSSLLQGF